MQPERGPTRRRAAPHRRRCGQTAQSSWCRRQRQRPSCLQEGGEQIWHSRQGTEIKMALQPGLAYHCLNAVGSFGSLSIPTLPAASTARSSEQLAQMQPAEQQRPQSASGRTLGQHEVDQLAAVGGDQASLLGSGSSAAATARLHAGKAGEQVGVWPLRTSPLPPLAGRRHMLPPGRAIASCIID